MNQPTMYEPYAALREIVRFYNLDSLLFGTYEYDEDYGINRDNVPYEAKAGHWPSLDYRNIELCIRSKTSKGHIRMIDFVTTDLNEVIRCLYHFGFQGNIYHSGNSYHFYATYLTSNWLEYMGNLLLYKVPNVIDIRWIGHSLIAGMSTLRVSNNTKSPIKFVQSFILEDLF